MRRYLLDKKHILTDYSQEKVTGSVTFTDEVYHHIFEVCRHKVGEKFEVLSTLGTAFLVEVTEVKMNSGKAKIIEQRNIERIKRPYINIAISIPRFHVIDSVIERSVEMGVKKIIPFTSEYSFIKKADGILPAKYERWGKIVASAMQQSGRGEVLTIDPVCNLQEMLQKINPGPKSWCLFAYEGDTKTSIKQYISHKISAMSEKPDEVWIIIGSEGGFSVPEVGQMQKLGLDPVTLGQQILRVETACLTLVSVLKYELGLWQ